MILIYCFNRTTVELKYIIINLTPHSINSFNRTTVELKYRQTQQLDSPHDCFNRTTVELKFGANFLLLNFFMVLIALQ